MQWLIRSTRKNEIKLLPGMGFIFAFFWRKPDSDLSYHKIDQHAPSWRETQILHQAVAVA